MTITQLPSKHQLEIQLEKLKILKTPKLSLEQYPVSSLVAAELLYLAGFKHHDLDGRTIDLGTGTGRLAIGAALMGAKRVVGIDVDDNALALARENASTAGVNVEWILSDIDQVAGEYDTVIMNPPYGTRTPHLDIQFLKGAFPLAPVIYSIHKSSTRDFVRRIIAKENRTIDELRSMPLDIPHLFPFHNRKWESVDVDLYRILC